MSSTLRQDICKDCLWPALIGLLCFGIINLLKPRAKISSILAKKEISKKILSFVLLALAKAIEKKYNVVEYE